MNVLHLIRRYSATLSRVNLALFVLVWLSVVIAPCAMAMQSSPAAAMDDCAHCVPRPCDEVVKQDCNSPDTLDWPRVVEKTQAFALLAPRTFEPVLLVPETHRLAWPPSPPRARAGPRPHLVHAQFNE